MVLWLSSIYYMSSVVEFEFLIMTDVRVAFLSRLAASISKTDKLNTLLKSFYLMRCRELVNDTVLLQKYFPQNLTCSHCGIKWTKDECIVNVKPKRIARSQKRKTKVLKEETKHHKSLKKKKALVTSNQLEKVCKFCKHSTFVNLIKPTTTDNKIPRKSNISGLKQESNDVTSKAKKFFIQNNKNDKIVKEEINVYSSTKDVFSLLNQNNLIPSNKSKAVKNNKRKKDKFAGLCKEAVLAMSNKKKEKESRTVNDKLNLFLKPSN